MGQALAAIGLLRAAPGEADLTGELRRLGSTELLRLEMANWLLGAASMQVLMATGAPPTTPAPTGRDQPT